jgi:hypothetical protein
MKMKINKTFIKNLRILKRIKSSVLHSQAVKLDMMVLCVRVVPLIWVIIVQGEFV